jgi:hypothetical protein
MVRFARGLLRASRGGMHKQWEIGAWFADVLVGIGFFAKLGHLGIFWMFMASFRQKSKELSRYRAN